MKLSIFVIVMFFAINSYAELVASKTQLKTDKILTTLPQAEIKTHSNRLLPDFSFALSTGKDDKKEPSAKSINESKKTEPKKIHAAKRTRTVRQVDSEEFPTKLDSSVTPSSVVTEVAPSVTASEAQIALQLAASGLTERQSGVREVDQINTVSSAINREDESVGYFAQNASYAVDLGQKKITLPSGSSVAAVLQGGFEVGQGKTQEMVIRLVGAFWGPNNTYVDLGGCYSRVSFEANFSTNRVAGAVKTFSCRAENKEPFEVQVEGLVFDSRDEMAGIKADLTINGASETFWGTLATDGIVGAGKALKELQVTSSAYGGGLTSDTTTTKNVTGNGAAYIVGGTLESGAARAFNKYLDHQANRLPTLAVKTGAKVFITTLGQVQLPAFFFNESEVK